MDRILPARCRWPLHGTTASREIEAAAIAAADPTGPRLMVRAGAAVARLATALAPFAERVWVAAGPGNNGGDGIEAAIHLHRIGRRVAITLVGERERLPHDAAESLREAEAAGLIVDASDRPAPPLRCDDLVIDALLGLGSRRAPAGPLAAMVARINSMPCTVLAVDLPTGLDGDHGRLLGDEAVRASATLSLLTCKPGLFTADGRDHAGDVWFDDLSTGAATRQPDAWLSGPPRSEAMRRSHRQHKGSFGDVAIVGGAAGMTGAALLCARSAHAAGAGRVWVAPLDPAMDRLDSLRPELMWLRDVDELAAGRLAGMTVVAGCGGGAAIGGRLPKLIAHAGRLVIDADGLNAIAGDAALGSALRRRGSRGLPSVLTPHPLEAARLLESSVTEVQHDRLSAASRLAERFAAVVVLKGSGSVIAAPQRIAHVNPTGGPALATAGSGDVLAGWLGGLWSTIAGGLSEPLPDAVDPAFAAACDAVWQHGAAADASHRRVLTAGALIEALAAGAGRD